MNRTADDIPTWRLFGAMLGTFALAAQLLVSGFIAGSMAGVPDSSDLAVICAHDPSAVDPAGAPGGPDQGKSHDLCPACTCALSGHHASTLPASPVLAVLRGRSETLAARLTDAGTDHRFHAPYASRAPPLFA